MAGHIGLLEKAISAPGGLPLQLGGVFRRLRQVALGGAQVQQFFLIVVHGQTSYLSDGFVVF